MALFFSIIIKFSNNSLNYDDGSLQCCIAFDWYVPSLLHVEANSGAAKTELGYQEKEKWEKKNKWVGTFPLRLVDTPPYRRSIQGCSNSQLLFSLIENEGQV